MNKKELIQAAASCSGISQVVMENALNSIVEVIKESMRKEEPVILRGFGTFLVKERSARQGRNPSTGQTMQIPAKKTVKFKLGNGLEIDSKK